ncbi:branched-chain amino acid aminotransferase [Kribbella sp. NPDC051587]|uniref:branched-chain amino acid aminotransferase n=1 Tax=Kribbella sp. NPDC051587 TaxID=3364119 RepID=UPI0037A62AE9
MSALEFIVEPNTHPASDDQRASILANPGFGQYFSDHMAIATWTKDQGWHDARITAFGPLELSPATSVFHYAQTIFEGMKAYRHPDDSIHLFRPEANAARFARSARRLALPELPESAFLDSVKALVELDQAWVPTGGETSLYLRPFMFGSDPFLGVRPSAQVTYCAIASPAGSYFSGGVKPVRIWLSEEYTRAAPGGTGAAKTGGNYAASLLAQAEATENGCDQVAFLDAIEKKWVEELGGMNLYFVLDDNSVVTPELSGTILEGVTRDSILKLVTDLGHSVAERKISVDEWREGAASGRIREVFACGTAAVITPVASLKWKDGEVQVADGNGGPVTAAVRSALLDLQYGRAADPHNWMTKIC